MSGESNEQQPAAPTWRQVWGPRLVALGISTSVALFVGELLVRALHGSPLPSRTPLSRVEANPYRGWQMLKDEDHYTYQHKVSINAYGLRGEQIPAAKPAGERRILALGDSMTYGQGVSDQTTLPAQLELALEERTQHPWRVINSGHRAYGTNQELGLLRELGPVLDPDVVMLFWYENDFEEYDIDKVNAEFLESGPRTFDIEARFTGLARVAWHAKQLIRRSALIMYVHDRVMAKAKQPLTQEQEQSAFENFELELQDFEQQCSEHGWRAVFVVVPHAATLAAGGENTRPGRRAERVKHAARELGLPVLELEPALRELTVEMGSAPTIPYDGHYLGIANRRMGEALAPALLALEE